MSEQLPTGEPRLSIEDVIRPLRRRAVAFGWLERLERQHALAREAVVGHMATIGSARGGYKLVPAALTEELNPDLIKYLNLEAHLLYARTSVPRYASSLEAGLSTRLKPATGPLPILHVKNDVRPHMQIGVIVTSPEDKNGDKTVYRVWEYPLGSAQAACEFSGPCATVSDGLLYIASEEHQAVFRVDPLSENGYPDENIHLSITYPESTEQ